MKNNILCIYDSLLGHASSQTRGILLKDQYILNGWNVNFLDYRLSTYAEIIYIAEKCDLIYSIKIADLNLYKAFKIYTHAKIVFDLIDSLWTPIHKQYGWQDLDEIITLSDAIFSDNEYVADYAKKLGKKIFIIPQFVPVEKFDEMRRLLRIKTNKKLVVGWIGSNGTCQALKLIAKHVVQLAIKYPNLEFRVLGCSDLSLLPNLNNQQLKVINEYNEEVMIRNIIEMDVGIFPAPLGLEDYVIRGGGKAYLYMGAAVPPVCHEAPGWVEEIEDGVTGMIVTQSEDWFTKIDLLLSNSELRQRIGKAGRQIVVERYSIETVFDKLQLAFLNVING